MESKVVWPRPNPETQAPIMRSQRNSKSKKSTVMIKDVVVDDDCVVLDCDPNNSVTKVDHKANYGSKSNDLLIVAEKGQIACRDYPHPRHLCVKYPFNSTPHYKHCDQCHCYVCECRAPCPLWNSDSVISNDRHCHATYKEERWKTLKKQLLNKRNPINVQPSASLRTGRQDLTKVDKLGQLIDSLSQSLTSLEQLLKKKKGQIYKGY
ncbi:hypothetical protein ACB092_12G178700 [Castanea dentata]